MGLDHPVKMCIVSSFVISGGLVAMGILEQFNTPLSRTTCFTGYTDCGNELRQHHYPPIPYIILGILLVSTMCVILNYNKVFNKIEVDK